MPRKARWEEFEIVDGVGEIRFFKWQYFIDFVQQEMLDYDHYIWRGQRNSDWKLESTLDRLIVNAKVAKTKRANFRKSHLEQFKYSVRGRRGSNPAVIDAENEWWALGQHHGLATPLLDWTSSPFAAAYFSFISTKGPQSRYRVVYAINRPGVARKVREIKKTKEKENRAKGKEARENGNALLAIHYSRKVGPEVEFIRPKSDENQRLVNQSGLFSRAPDGVNLDDWISENYKGGGKSYTLMKLLIPNKDRTDCLRTLNRMNINHLTLFPDLYGASKYFNLYGEIDKY